MAACSFSFNPKQDVMCKIKSWLVDEKKHVRYYHDWNDKEVRLTLILIFVMYGSFQSLIWASVLCVFATGRSVEQILVFDIQTDDLPREPLWKRLRQEKE